MLSKRSVTERCSWHEAASHLLPCFQPLLPERSICRAASILSINGQSSNMVVEGSSGSVKVGELTSWPPALCLLLNLVVISTIYGFRMSLRLRHYAIGVCMSGFGKKKTCLSLLSLSLRVAGKRGERRADAKDAATLMRMISHCVHIYRVHSKIRSS